MKNLFPLLLSVLMVSCSTEPEQISYGHDACHFCDMTIVSKGYAAQAVSIKGKQYKYDAIECLVNDLERKDEEMAVMQVSDFMAPGNMVKVHEARFVINDTLNSPMGENLAALKNGSLKAKHSKNLLTWEQLKFRFQQQENEITNN